MHTPPLPALGGDPPASAARGGPRGEREIVGMVADAVADAGATFTRSSQ